MRIILLTMLLLATLTDAVSQDASARFKQLQAIIGNWSMQTKKGIIYESWSQASDSSLTGKSYRIVGEDSLLLEELGLVRKGNDIFYIPAVRNQNGQEPVTFKLLKVENDNYVFDNPAHDFPQRIIYHLPKSNTMHAWIEGMDKGIYRKSDFYYKKVM